MSDTRKIMYLDLSAEKTADRGYYYAELALPAENYEILDAMQRLRAAGREDSVWVNILECADLPALENVRLDSPTLDELNFFAKRLVSMTEEENVVFRAVVGQVLREHHEGELVSMKDLINSTYGLDSVPIASNISDLEGLGRLVLESGLNDDLTDVSEEAIPYLNVEQIGRVQQEGDGGVFLGRYYVVTGYYERPEIYDGRTLPESEEAEPFVFRVKIGEYPTDGTAETEDDAEWLSLPAEADAAENMAARHHEPSISSCACYAFESSIPQITSEMFDGMLDFDRLNRLAWQFHLLSPADQVKCKAALSAEKPDSVNGALDITKNLWRYEFYSNPENSEEFFKAYLKRHLDSHFDNRWLDTLLPCNEGEKLLKCLGASVTEYGAISARGRSLYELVPYREPEIRAEYVPTMTGMETAEADTEENEEMQIGGMHL